MPHPRQPNSWGMRITVAQEDSKRTKGQRTVNGVIQLRVPQRFVEERCARSMSDEDFSIVAQYQAEYRGYVQYYSLAVNIAKLNKLRWVMRNTTQTQSENTHERSTTPSVETQAK